MVSQLELDRRQMLGGIALGLGGVALAACGSQAGAQDDGVACVRSPTETKGPFPADGSNGRPRPVNVLAMEGVVRRDIRASFAGRQGRAEGVPLELALEVLGPGCKPLRGFAVYLWQNDAAGAYSLYDLPEANYLRGLQAGDRHRPAEFTTIVPGCYGGRYPHCHFEVFASAEAALTGAPPLLVSQLAIPERACRAIYANDGRYGESLRNLEHQPLERDFVFSDTVSSQIVALLGDPARGYRGAMTIVIGA